MAGRGVAPHGSADDREGVPAPHRGLHQGQRREAVRVFLVDWWCGVLSCLFLFVLWFSRKKDGREEGIAVWMVQL